jgi:aspartyl-tRNA(Asn)/glutamyl-tRNA(Gln) amidotransferase subunit B
MSAERHPDYEVVIGLEVHSQLRTRTKLFSPSEVTYGAEPNHYTSPVCLGLPGALPVLNGRAVELAVRAALATHCEVHPRSIFARKNYFYPDLPKGYQISQFEEPLATGGWVEIPGANGDGTRRIGLTRIHMEEDAGKSIHDGAVTETHVDLNRAGVPLVEIVSEPDLRSSTEAGAYLRALREILRYVGASDADMEKGQFRCDANVSLRPWGETELGTRTELKNLNSFRFVEEAIRFEVGRQATLLDHGDRVEQATYGYDAEKGRSFLMRDQENADDHRYFPDPDLIPLQVPPERIEEIRAALPELPEQKRSRFVAEYGLGEDTADLLTGSRGLADFFEEVARASGDPAASANWVARDLLGALREQELEFEGAAIAPGALAVLIGMVGEGRVTARSARSLVPDLVREGGDPEAMVRERGLESVSDAGVLEPLVDEVLAAHPDAVETCRGGDPKALNFLMGQVMRRTGGKADPAGVRALLAAKLEE